MADTPKSKAQADPSVELALREGAELPAVDDPEEVAKAIVSRILAAPDADTVLATFEATSWREYLDEVVRIMGVRWQRSSFEEGPTVYALVDGVLIATGERLTLTVGGRSVMAALYRLAELGALPMDVKLSEARNPTPDGFKPLRLTRVVNQS